MTTPRYLNPSPSLWVRLEEATEGRPTRHVTVTGPNDESPVQLQRDSRCSLCSIHAPHSEAAHHLRIGRAA